MAARNNPAAQPTSADLIITRTYDAPRALVFAAWTEPEHLKQWWAPDGCSTPYCTVDLRVGGKFHFCMRLPDGKEIWAVGIYSDVSVPERLVYWDSFADADGNPVPPSHYGMSAGYPEEMLVSISFAEQGGRTTVTLRHIIPRDFPERADMEKGWNEMFNRMAQLVAKNKGSAPAAGKHLAAQPAMADLVVTRTYDAPRALVFAAWTEPEQLKQWWAPEGCSTPHCTVDLRVGGKFHFCMRVPGGPDFWSLAVYREVVVPERLVYAQTLSDADGNPKRPSDYGMSDQLPAEARFTVTFAEQNGRTTVTLRHHDLPAVFPERAAMEDGWNEMFAQLAQLVTRA